MAETISGYEATSWFAVFTAKGVPKDITVRWNSELNRVLQSPDVKERMAGLGIDIAGGSPEHLRDYVGREIAKWRKVVKLANIKPQE